MLKYDKKEILEKDYDTIISGTNSEYSFYSSKKAIALNHIKGKNVICILSSIAKNELGLVYNRIEYCDDISLFYLMNNFKQSNAHTIFLKSVENKEKAAKIILDISSKHIIPNLHY